MSGLSTHYSAEKSSLKKNVFWPLVSQPIIVGLFLSALLLVSACGPSLKRSGTSYVIKGKRYHILASAEGFREKGLASWYGEPFHGRKTANGEIYDMNKISAAHKTLPLNTWVEVKNLDNGRKLLVRINDRGPFVRGRIIDLSRAAAEKMGMLKSGVAEVSLRAVSAPNAHQLAQTNKLSSLTEPAISAGREESLGVRVISTANIELARQVVKALKKRHSGVSLNQYLQSGQAVFAVTIDGLKSRKEADKLRSRLVFRGYEGAVVVSR